MKVMLTPPDLWGSTGYVGGAGAVGGSSSSGSEQIYKERGEMDIQWSICNTEDKDTENIILSRLESDITDARLKELDDYDEVEAKVQARQTASQAAEKQEKMKNNYDEKCCNLNMSEAADHAGDRPQPGIFEVKYFNISHFVFLIFYS